ncbi:EscD/YscD/HrpQ family type III secretion system inner membrane ring protein, partial [Vibrio splendidus]
EEVSVNNEIIAVDAGGVDLSRKALVSVGRLTFAVGYLEDDLVIEMANDVASKQAKPIGHKPSSGWKKMLLIGLICGLIPSVIFIGIWYDQVHASDKDVITEAEPIVLVRNILSELELNDVRVEWNANA